MISKLKVDELKSFLRLRNLKVSGSKNELISRVFVAVENNVPVVPTAVEIEENLAASYDKKLVFDDIKIPDPFNLKLFMDGRMKMMVWRFGLSLQAWIYAQN